MERIVISDTNVLIDLISMGLLRDFFALPYEFHTSDFVMDEVDRTAQKEEITEMVRKGLLKVESIAPADMPAVASLLDGNLSITDCSIWYLARENKWTILSGDRKLNIRVKTDNIQIHGILFVLDELVGRMIIPCAYAAEKLEVLAAANKRLPHDEIVVRLQKWTSINANNSEMEDKIK